MNFESRRAIRCAMATMVLCLLGTPWARAQSAKPGTDQKPQMSEEAFKNIQVLRGIPVNEFMGTMGFFAASLGMNCTDCHINESAGNWDRYADDTPLKQTARRMVLMENLINRSDFGATRMVTCYTCHRGVQHPEVTPSLAEQYGAPPPDDPDRVEVLPNTPDDPAAAGKILDKFIQAVGGAQQLAKLNSFTAKGTYSGFDTNFQKVPTEISAKAPDQLTMTNHLPGGDDTTTFDGHEGWYAAADKPVPLILMTGGELDGARLDAQLSFPAQIKHVAVNGQCLDEVREALDGLDWLVSSRVDNSAKGQYNPHISYQQSMPGKDVYYAKTLYLKKVRGPIVHTFGSF